MINESTAIKPAICCLGYSRPDSMQRLLNSIGMAKYQCYDIPLIISIDECSESDSVQRVAEDFEWKYGEKIIKRYPKRLGVRKHTLLVGDLSYQYGAVIYLEDDIVVAPGYYTYMTEALKKYADNPNVFGVALYNQRWLNSAQTEFLPVYNGEDVYLFSGDISWGQCWIAEQWKAFHEWYDKHINTLPEYNKGVPKSVYMWDTRTSWSKFISFYLAEKKTYYVVPYESYSTCFSDKGVHAGMSSDHCQVPLSQSLKEEFRFPDIKRCVMYDAFFERIDPFVEEIAGIPISDICIDLNGEKYDFSGYKAVLTTKRLKYKCISSFGVNMDPIELNVKYNNPGFEIKLYELPDGEKLNIFEQIPYPVVSDGRVFHQQGKCRFEVLMKLVMNKIRNHFFRR